MDKKEEASKKIRQVFNKIAMLNASIMASELSEYTPSEVHVIEFIGENNQPNVTKLAQGLYMTKGAISKISKKLITKGAIETVKKADNKKEVYFLLTDKGQEVFDTHKSLHDSFEKRDEQVFEDVTDQEYARIIEIMEKYSGHLDKEIEKSGLEM